MAEESSFQPFFATLGQSVSIHSADVNAGAAARLEQILKSPVDGPGRGILLRAPRAGFGKTHLLSRTRQRLSSTHEFLPLSLIDGSRLDAAVAIESALRRLTRQLPAGGGLTALDLQARRVLALALQPLVSSGEVPCQDREAALNALRQRPVETFDFHQPQAVTAHWTKENFEVLGPRLALELSRRTGSSLNETSFWLAALFRFSIAVPEHPGRTGLIIQGAVNDAGVERFAALLAMLSLIGRVVLVADDLEGLHAAPEGALRFGTFLATVRQEAPRIDAVVSINDDVWTSAFEPALSGGLQDRLGEIEIRLDPLDEAGVEALVRSRFPERAEEILPQLSRRPEDLYSRRVLRAAVDLAAQPAPAPTPALAPTPVPEALIPAPEAGPVSPSPAPAAFVPAPPAPDAAEPVAEPVQAPAPAGPPAESPFAAAAAAPPPALPPSLSVTPEPSPAFISSSPSQRHFAAAVAEESPVPTARAVEIANAPVAESSPFQPAPGPQPFKAVEPVKEPAIDGADPSGEKAPRSESGGPDAPAPVTPPPLPEVVPGLRAAPEGERIDDLLRQFRDRYGRD